VPGDHDSMVLEPNVRVLAARLKAAILAAEATAASAAHVQRKPGSETSAAPTGWPHAKAAE